MPLTENESTVVGLAAAAYFLGTGIGRSASDGTLSRDNITKAVPPIAAKLVLYVQRSLPWWKETVTLESLDYAAAVRGWSTLMQDILSRMERGQESKLALTSDLYIFLCAIASQKLGILSEFKAIFAKEQFLEVQDSLPSEDGAEEELAESVAA